MRELLLNKLRLAADNLWELSLVTESDYKYRGFVEDWSEEELLLKYVGAEKNDRYVVERWLPIDSIIEVAYVREPNLDESWLINDHTTSLLFAEDNPGAESDTIIQEIFESFDDFDFLEEEI